MTRLLIDPAADFDDPGAVTITATLLDPGPSIVRTFTDVTTDTVVDLPAPDTTEAWRLTIRRPVTTINRWNIASTNPGPIVAERTVHFPDGDPITWAALTDVDPGTLRTTAVPSAAWDAAIAELRAEVDALPTGGGGGGFSGAYADLTGTPAIPSTPADIGAEPAGTADARIADLVDGAPDALNTLKELAAQLATDEGAAAGLATAVAGKEPAGLSTSTKTALGATYATKLDALASGLTVMGLGDSITYNGGNDLADKFKTVGDFYFTDKSWHLYAQMYSGGKFQHLGNAALGGYTIEQVRDTWLPAVLAVRPALCVVLAGQNNLGTLSAANLAALGDIYDQLLTAGIVPVLCTNPATESTTNLFRLNAWIRRQSRERGLPLADLYAATVDPATGLYKAGYSTDGVHPIAAGAMAMGQALADTLAPYLRAGSADLAQSNGGFYGIVPGPLFLTDNGATPPSPTAGWTPLTTYQPGDFSYSANPSGPGRTFTIARRAGGVDNKIRVALGTPTTGDVLRWATRIAVTVPTGGTVQLDFTDGQSTSVLNVTFTRSITGVVNLERPARASAPHLLDITAGGVDGTSVGLAQFTFQNLSALAAV